MKTLIRITLLFFSFLTLVVFQQNCSRQNLSGPAVQTSENNLSQLDITAGKPTSKVLIDNATLVNANENTLNELLADIQSSGGQVLQVLPNGDLEVEYPSIQQAEQALERNTLNNKNGARAKSNQQTLINMKRKLEFSVERPTASRPFDPSKIKLFKGKNVGHIRLKRPILKQQPNNVALARNKVQNLLGSMSTSAASPSANTAIYSKKTIVGYDNSNSDFFPPIGDQLNLGSCTTWAAGYYFNSYTNAKTANVSINSPSGQNYLCSPAFLYPLVNGGLDLGANLLNAVEIMSEFGCVPLNTLPYKSLFIYQDTKLPMDEQFFPSVDDQKLALKNRMKSIEILADYPMSEEGLTNIKQALDNGNLIITGAEITMNFFTYNGLTKSDPVQCQDGITRTYSYPDGVLSSFDLSCGGVHGGHAFTIVGYDDKKMAFKISNSWGTEWGEKGFAWISYDLFRDSRFATDYFITATDYPTTPKVSAYMEVTFDIDHLPTQDGKYAPLLYTANSDYLNWDLTKLNSFPLARQAFSRQQAFTLVHDLTNYLIPGKPISGRSTLTLSTAIDYSDKNLWWKDYLDPSTVLSIFNVQLFQVNGTIETKVSPLDWEQTDNSISPETPYLSYGSQSYTLSVESEALIRPDDTSIIPADVQCSAKELPAGLKLDPSTCIISGKPTIVQR